MTVAAPRTGYLAAIPIFGVPIYIHWSFAGSWVWWGALTQFMMGGLSIAVFGWTALSVAFVIACHELGHATTARLLRVKVLALIATGSGGACVTEPVPSRAKRTAILLAGVSAQSILLLTTVFFILRFGAPTSTSWTCICLGFIGVNGFLILLNLMPVAGTDGAQLASLYRRAPKQ